MNHHPKDIIAIFPRNLLAARARPNATACDIADALIPASTAYPPVHATRSAAPQRLRWEDCIFDRLQYSVSNRRLAVITAACQAPPSCIGRWRHADRTLPYIGRSDACHSRRSKTQRPSSRRAADGRCGQQQRRGPWLCVAAKDAAGSGNFRRADLLAACTATRARHLGTVLPPSAAIALHVSLAWVQTGTYMLHTQLRAALRLEQYHARRFRELYEAALVHVHVLEARAACFERAQQCRWYSDPLYVQAPRLHSTMHDGLPWHYAARHDARATPTASLRPARLLFKELARMPVRLYRRRAAARAQRLYFQELVGLLLAFE
ncbi:hypothetical protein SDRG_01790 [Saprolegnia diclina VS20]|uniref:Uncharacterized protein n=1 Tax=Saprolegnia diclina (strain VS20) TaxID=1156394 RepID=T0S6E5_SAPDV|nr:hypothetical protein SDRG_01790 [Saprolegnia diclina VS20]EQC40718.1 hypothetical protein SDRG_01790 [Saprolegnia diclina VS20]|eukprot:XP_008605562.1 hypothetical protein SDRG_01790 [Saprolegnia diclina VS20]